MQCPYAMPLGQVLSIVEKDDVLAAGEVFLMNLSKMIAQTLHDCANIAPCYCAPSVRTTTPDAEPLAALASRDLKGDSTWVEPAQRELATLTTVASLVLSLMILGMPLGASAQSYGVDDGTHITLWSRAATQARADALVQAYNATHKNHVDATYVPTDDYQTKVGAAAAAGGLPDLFSADVVFMPNWTSAGLFTRHHGQDRNAALCRQHRPGCDRRVDLGRQEIRSALRRRPLGVDVQQEAVQGGRPRSQQAADDARGVRG